MSGTDMPVRNIDRALARWVRERSGSNLLARAASAVSQAEGQGHACVALASEDAFSPEELAALRAHAWVGDGSRSTAFVLDRCDNFYTWRNWRHETRLAECVRSRAADRDLPPARTTFQPELDALFAGDDPVATRWQRIAVAAVAGARLFVLTGGPGTGKTSTALRMLAMLLCRPEAAGLPAYPRVALAAPTGKAAQRLAEAVTDGGRELLLGPAAASENLRAALERLQTCRAQTLHRLLGFRPYDNTYSHGPHNPLGSDIVVVDEASMIDLAMMRRLFDALPRRALLILLGDPDQLHAVEAGSVLRDIVASVPQNRLPAALARRLGEPVAARSSDETDAPLAGQVITLTHAWRAQGGLQRDIEALRRGDAIWLEELIGRTGEAALVLNIASNPDALNRCIDRWIDTHREIYAPLFMPGIAPARALQLARSAQILCALRRGVFAAEHVNTLLAKRLARQAGFDAGRLWYPGRIVIITRNDYARDLYNGDIGIALEGSGGLRVWFDGRDGPRDLAPYALPEHESAWAITVHRSQGSEYDDVAVLLPPDPDSPILSRELLYTAVSRARERAQIWAADTVLRRAVATPAVRYGGLRERLG